MQGRISSSYQKKTGNNKGPLVGDGDASGSLPLFDFSRAEFSYEPFPVGFLHSIFPDSFYSRLVDSFPDESTMTAFPDKGHKYLLSEGSDPLKYQEHIRSHPAWSELHSIVKSVAFVQYCYDALKKNQVDLGMPGIPVLFPAPAEELDQEYITARFEFSSLAVPGGYHRPHTDLPKKMVSLIIPMIKDNNWKKPEAGALSICSPVKKEKIFNQVNQYLDFDEVTILRRYPFLANSGILFPKTFNSWHCVEPLQNENARFRRTIVIQLLHIR